MSMYTYGAQNVYRVSSINTYGAQNVYAVSAINTYGAKNVYQVSSINTYGAQNVYQVSSINTYGAQNVFFVGCFPGSELVSMDYDTNIPISLLSVGDRIISWKAESKKTQYTTITDIHKYIVNEIIYFNNSIRCSSSHPIMVIEHKKSGIYIPKWKVAFDINIGDYIIGIGGKYIKVKTKSNQWYNEGIEVFNLSTEEGAPFLVGSCVVRAENSKDCIEWADTPVTKKLSA